MKSVINFLTITFLFTIACNSVKNTEHGAMMNDKYFTLLHASSQSWTAGIPSGGSGTEYYFEVKINSSKEITFDSAWINNKSYPLFVSKETNAISSDPVRFVKGDSITLRVSDLTNAANPTSPAKPPIPYTGAALIGYKANGKQVYFIIKEIEKKPSVPRQ